MNYIVFDLEWNQSNTGKEPEISSIPFEIIDIGAIRLNEDCMMIGEFNQLVKPTVYEQMHHITSKIIHLHMQDLMRGKPFVEAMEDFLSFSGEDCIYCTWGPLDLYELQRNMKHYNMTPLSYGPVKFLDIQKLYSLAFDDGKQRKALETAVDELKMEKDIPFHRAFSDAYYTAKVMKLLPKDVLEYYSFDTFCPPANRENEIKVQFKDYAKYISREFPDKHTAMEDKEVSSTKCYLCHKNLRKKIRWFSPNLGKHYYSIAECPVHGYIKYKNRMKKSESGNIFVVKTSKFVDEKTLNEFLEKKKLMEEKKKAAKG